MTYQIPDGFKGEFINDTYNIFKFSDHFNRPMSELLPFSECIDICKEARILEALQTFKSFLVINSFVLLSYFVLLIYHKKIADHFNMDYSRRDKFYRMIHILPAITLFSNILLVAAILWL